MKLTKMSFSCIRVCIVPIVSQKYKHMKKANSLGVNFHYIQCRYFTSPGCSKRTSVGESSCSSSCSSFEWVSDTTTKLSSASS